MKLDHRINAVRNDLADIALADRVIAPRYVQPLPMHCATAVAMLRGAPDTAATATSALLYGEAFAVFDIDNGWAWGQCAHDGYVGYVEAAALTADALPATHRVSAPSALVFSRADIKAPVLADLPLGALLAAADHDEKFIAAADGFIHRRHVAALSDFAPDALEVARQFIGTPYLWGGRSRAGIDCSGLVQVALMAAGQFAPRDSDQQAQGIGDAVALADRAPGDLLFIPGHVGFIDHDDRLLHANAFWMRTASEPLADMLARLPEGTVISLRRPGKNQP
ncbi:C40 family peptidase [Polymorphobacter arshaanensis]|uniref:C40 family peptidase n=1 Tax=Glacieibacterium arshaanense TaxID=2511025 RepID=UPI001FB19A88|nr:NlpC/P60 family protein [Polymorphobacter arshaanensis]